MKMSEMRDLIEKRLVGKKRIKDPMPPNKSEPDNDSYEGQYKNEREFKVRIIERLGNLESRLN